MALRKNFLVGLNRYIVTKNFSDFNIITKRSFEGAKLYPEDLLSEPIIVHYYEVRPSKKNDGTECLYAQITLNNEKRLLWSSSVFLIDAIRKIPDNGFPFGSKIIKVNRHFEFR